MRNDILQLALAAAGLWLIPFLPVVVAVLIAWATSWAFPSLVMVGFMCGWPVTWFRWVRHGGEENAR